MLNIEDFVHAFMPYPFKKLESSGDGPLTNTTFAVKDLFDVAGYPTGCGSPLKLAESKSATANAAIVDRALNAGAEFVGKTKTDELAWSLEGINSHFGTPINPKAPNRIPGGSSSGSASAVAAGLVDFAIGTDTGGSIRAPASFCGLWGIRPTHGRLPLTGCMELAASFDTCGFFARTGIMFESVADAMFEEEDSAEVEFGQESHLLAEDLVNSAAEDCKSLITANVPADHVEIESVEVFQSQRDEIYHAFRILQANEVLQKHGPWVEARNPPLEHGVAERFKFANGVTSDDVTKAEKIRQMLRDRLDDILDGRKVIFTPTVPTEPPLLATDLEGMVEFRHKALTFLCIAGLCGLPQLSIPVGTGDSGAPIGLSLIGPTNSDRSLIRFARLLFPDL